jgi:surface protein
MSKRILSKKVLTFLLIALPSVLFSQSAFVTRWDLATAGSGATQLSFGTATSGTVTYTWQEISPGSASGSGSFTGTTLTITGLPGGAIIRLSINPTNFQRINIFNGADRSRLLDVEQWGSTVWTSMLNAFYGCNNLNITATDIPVLTSCTSMVSMFNSCTTLNGPSNINAWNTAAVTNMSQTFSSAPAFNQPIGSWNTSNVTSISTMFFRASAFNQDIGSWNVSKCTSFQSLFDGATNFNNGGSPTINSWNTAAVTNMRLMFNSATSFNQPIGSWNTGNVTSISAMFSRASAFNQNIGSWNVSKVTNFQSTFDAAANFNNGGIATINFWILAAGTTNMQSMFANATAFNQNIGDWNTEAVTNMSGMFTNATAFNQNIGSWNLNANVNLSNMLDNSGMDCSNYSATLVGWQANAGCPTGRTLGAAGKTYDPTATAARNNLVLASGSGGKGWTITGDAFSSSCGALPVTWLDFTGQFAKNNVILNWKTASEQNNTGFDVERSADGRSWSKIGFIPGKTNSAVPTPYSYTDLSPLKGLSYYRLKQFDLDNKFSYSRIVQINGLTTDEASIWPNPVTNMLNIGINERYRNEKLYLTVTDMKGTVLVSRTVTHGNSAISTAAWSKALYVVTLRSGGNIIMTKKIVRE